MKKELDREQWILANQMVSAIMNLNAPFCDSGPAEGPNEEWLNPISEHIAEHASLFALEDVIPILEKALEIATKKREKKTKRKKD